jgi:pro-kumamolisin-like protein/subtilase family protein
MIMGRRCRRDRTGVVVVCFLIAVVASSQAQAQLRDRIRTAINDSDLAQLRGNVHPLARAEFDRGQVADSTRLPRVNMFFAPSPAQQTALTQLLSEQQDRASLNYHRWLTPQEFGMRFGLSQNDLSRVASWLESRGFVVHDIPASRNAISFSGSAAQVASAFGTAIHRYVVNGSPHYANAGEPSVPAALAGLISGFSGLNDFRPKPKMLRRMDTRPRPNFTDGTTNHFLAPADFELIYNVTPLYGHGIDGTGQKIAIVGQSDVQLDDIREFRSLMGLPTNDPQIVLVPGSGDPGMRDGDLQEADLDLEWAGAVARNATLIYVNSPNAWDSLHYAVQYNIAPVVSVSYGRCEPDFSSSDVQAFLALGQQANAQGQTIVVASGDSGAAACDNPFTQQATQGLAVSLPGSLPYVTAVGGTEFNEASGTYWDTTNNAANASVLSYIPEIAWNDSFSGFGLEATGGGASRLFSKPLWQSGPGVPDDSARDIPDVSFSASANHDGYLVCDESYNSTTNTFTPVCPNGFYGGFAAVGGTSAPTPAFAGIVALLNQSMNLPQGNINYILYSLARLAAGPVHDITSGDNLVACRTNPSSPDCPTSGSIAGYMGYNTGTGYDLATGLGSVDASALIGAWPSISLSPDFEITVSPSSLTLNRGSVATAEIVVNDVGGMTGVPSLACSVPTGFVGVTCSIAPRGGNIFTLTLASSNNAQFASGNIAIRTRASARAPNSPAAPIPAHGLWLNPLYARGTVSLPLAVCLLIAFVAIGGHFSRRASGRTRFAPFFALACGVAALLGCAGATSPDGGPAQALSVAASLQLAPQSAMLGQNQQQQFTASMENSSNGSFLWSVSPSVGSGSAAASNSAAAVYTAPSVINARQMVTLTATNVADPTKQASATILLLPPESGAIQVTGNLNGLTHTVALSLTVN